MTTGKSSPASPFDVVVGSNGSDTVSLAKLVGSLGTATPTFVYGLAGNDTINGTGMTGKLGFVGGKGADTMIGGSGVNDYLYGGAGASTASAMDIITNFDVTKDLIDLTGFDRGALAYVGQFSGPNLAARSVGWKPIGGNTFVYVNTSSSSESITGTNMKIELLGSLSLTSSNILHH